MKSGRKLRIFKITPPNVIRCMCFLPADLLSDNSEGRCFCVQLKYNTPFFIKKIFN